MGGEIGIMCVLLEIPIQIRSGQLNLPDRAINTMGYFNFLSFIVQWEYSYNVVIMDLPQCDRK